MLCDQLESNRQILIQLLAQFAYEWRDVPFQLTSGVLSNEYLDCKRALSHAAALPVLGAICSSMLRPGVVAIGGLTMGADPLAIATSCVSALRNQSIRWFSARKIPKAYGRHHMIEGDIRSGDLVAVVDDVVTSGQSTIDAVRKCRGANLHVAQVMVLIDRQEQNGLASIRHEAGIDVPVEAIFTMDDIRQAGKAIGIFSHVIA